MNVSWLAGGAVLAVLATIWGQAKSIWLQISSYAIVRVKLDWAISHPGEEFPW